MISTIPYSPSFSVLSFNPTITNTPSQFPLPRPIRHRRLTVKAQSSNSPVLHHLKTLAGAALFTAATTTAALTFPASPARAEPSPTLTEVIDESDTVIGDADAGETSPLSEFLETNNESIEALLSLFEQKVELGEDEEALKILKSLISLQPEETELKFIAAWITTKTGDIDTARSFYEEILKSNPLSMEALFENAYLMECCGEGEAIIERLEDALRVAVEDNKEKEARNVRMIMAEIQFLRNNADESLGLYEVLIKEDPNDSRPYFGRGVVYTLLGKNDEAKEQFAKYKELSPKKFKDDGYWRSFLSRFKQFKKDCRDQR